MLYEYGTGVVGALGVVVTAVLLAAYLAKRRPLLFRAATMTLAVTVVVMSVGLVARWFEAGEVEVAAIERAMDMKLTGGNWWVVFTQHPPWSNAYELTLLVPVKIATFVLWLFAIAYASEKHRQKVLFAFAGLALLSGFVGAGSTGLIVVSGVVNAVLAFAVGAVVGKTRRRAATGALVFLVLALLPYAVVYGGLLPERIGDY